MNDRDNETRRPHAEHIEEQISAATYVGFRASLCLDYTKFTLHLFVLCLLPNDAGWD